MAIPREIQLLRRLAADIDAYFAMMEQETVVRSDDLYNFLKRRAEFREWCGSYKQFCRFLHLHHDSGLMRQIVKKYRADTDGYYYKYYFYPVARSVRSESGLVSAPESCGEPRPQSEAQAHTSANKSWRGRRVFETANGVMVRSGQERYIMNKLLTVSHLEVWYERRLTAGGEDRFPDFTVRNNNTDTVFFWEHFGLTRDDDYRDRMAERIAWYRRIGIDSIDSIDRGGRFIGTIFVSENHFIKLVDDVIAKLDTIIVPVGFLRKP